MSRHLRRKNRSQSSTGPDSALVRADAALQVGDLEVARRALEKAVRAQPGNFAAWANLGAVQQQLENTAGAQRALNRALALQPDSVPLLSNLAALANQTGASKEALALYRRALALAPDDAELWHDLARIKTFRPGDPDLAAIEALTGGDGERAMFAAYALGKAYEDIDEWDRSFERTAQANAIKRRQVNFDLAAEVRFARRLMERFSAAFFAALGGVGSDSELPIFILGMPRSGTTLVEQILASHDAVHGGGEREDLRAVVGKGIQPFPDAVAGLQASDWRALGDAYVSHLARLDRSAKHVTDKMPRNFYFVGVIAAALPKARIVHCRRSPMDTCLSCFGLHFPYGQEFTCDLAELGGYYRAYRGLMEHWHGVLPGRILDVDYEQIVSDPETQARRLIDFCGLPWQDQCLDFHNSKRQVATASAAQVREPVHSRSVARWRRFEKYLGPLRAALGPYADPISDAGAEAGAGD
jgi:tetratricopeptide (TPR) repeat protein